VRGRNQKRQNVDKIPEGQPKNPFASQGDPSEPIVEEASDLVKSLDLNRGQRATAPSEDPNNNYQPPFYGTKSIGGDARHSVFGTRNFHKVNAEDPSQEARDLSTAVETKRTEKSEDPIIPTEPGPNPSQSGCVVHPDETYNPEEDDHELYRFNEEQGSSEDYDYQYDEDLAGEEPE
jgi:hypothetical protein